MTNKNKSQDMKLINYRVDANTWQIIRYLVYRKDCSIKDLMSEALQYYIKHNTDAIEYMKKF